MNIITKIYTLSRQIDMKVRRDLIRLLGLRSRENFFLDSPIASPRRDVQRLGIYAKAETFTVPHLTHENDTVTYSFTRRYIYEIPNAIIDPVTGMVYDEHGKYIAESMAWEPTRLLSEIPRPRIKVPSVNLKGRYVFLPTTPTYYHWLMQDLPPFIAALESDNTAKVILGSHDFKPVDEVVKMYLKHRDIQKYNTPIRVEKLIMVAKDGGLGIPFPPHGSVNPADVKGLQNYFNKHRVKSKIDVSEKLMLYLSRSRWSRALAGELLLEKELEKVGFTIFHGDLPFFEQIKLFSQAKVIVGASGAAMSNMIWAPENTKVIQLHLPSIYWNFYCNLGHICKHQYHFLEVPKESWTESDIDSIVIKVKNFILE